MDKKFLLAFGKNLKELRLSKEFTQEELSYQSELSLSQIARLETGRLNPTLCTLKVLASTLKISIGQLVDF